VQDFLLLGPCFAATARTFYEKWIGADLAECMAGAWRKAGLKIA